MQDKAIPCPRGRVGLQPGRGEFAEISIETGAPTHMWAVQLNTPFLGKKKSHRST